jgi:dUTP pyrophosphatase
MSSFLNNLSSHLLVQYDKYMNLKVYVDSPDNELKNKYSEAIDKHNLKIFNNINHIDAGFDLLNPETKQFTSGQANKLDYKIIVSAKMIKKNNSHYTGFYMYPRSSISKTNLRLANNVGIIDAGYRGHLIGMFDLINTQLININQFDRYLQICAPGLIPIIVELVDSIDELGEETTRGDGGFGSTGF